MKILLTLAASLEVLWAVEAAIYCTIASFDLIQTAVDTCDDITLDNIQVPPGQTLRLDLRTGTTVTFRGNTSFGYYEWEGPLVDISGSNVVIQGEEGSVFDGQGQLYWDGMGEWGPIVKPKFFTLKLHTSAMYNINILNNPLHAVQIADSSNVKLFWWVIDSSSGDSIVPGLGKAGRNTDGFDIWNSTDITISSCLVRNQDDCVAVRSGANILVQDFICYGGHGLSLSVGFSNETYELNVLQNVIIRDSILKGGDNAIHIKTHVDASEGLLQNVTYENIVFQGIVKNGIKIQENYVNTAPNSSVPDNPRNNIPIKDLKFHNVVGTVEDTAVPIYVLCAEDGCFDWNFTGVSVVGSKPNNCSYAPEDFEC